MAAMSFTARRSLLVRALAVALVCAGGCDDESVSAGDADVGGGVADAGLDGAGLDAGPDGMGAMDAGLDAMKDAIPDAIDGMFDAIADAIPDSGPVDPQVVCPVVESPREGLRVAGCRLVRRGDGQVAPLSVVVSADSLDRVAATPLHEPPQYAELAAAGVEVVWLLVLWDAIEPSEGTYNGAYMGRVCQQARWAGAAGLDVVLSMDQARFGPGFGGHGVPGWVAGGAELRADVGPDDARLGEAWRALWGGGVEAFEAAWVRLLDTCAADEAHGIDGIHVIAGPLDHDDAHAETYRGLSDAVVDAAEARLGAMLRFEDPLWTPRGLRWPDEPGADRIRTVPAWGAGRWPESAAGDPDERLRAARDAAWAAGRPLWVRAAGGADPAAMADAVAAVEAAGVPGSVWQDGFGGAYALRDDDGAPGPSWPIALERPRPALLAGRAIEWRSDAGLWVRWWADGAAQGLSRFDMAGRPVGAVSLSPAGLDWFSDYDPATDLLTVFVAGAPGVVELEVLPSGGEEGR